MDPFDTKVHSYTHKWDAIKISNKLQFEMNRAISIVFDIQIPAELESAEDRFSIKSIFQIIDYKLEYFNQNLNTDFSLKMRLILALHVKE